MNIVFSRILYFSAIAVFLCSLMQEAYTVNGTSSIGSFGMVALLFGWMNFCLSGLSWLANPCFIMGCIFFKRRLPALLFSGLGFALAMSFLVFNNVLINEGGTKGSVDGFLSGYWLWSGSHFLLFDSICIRHSSLSKSACKL